MSNSSILPNDIQQQPHRTRVDLGAIAMKGYSGFSKTPTLLEPINRLFNVKSRTLIDEGYYYSAEIQLLYPSAPPDWDVEW